MSKESAISKIYSGQYDEIMSKIYFTPEEVEKQKERYVKIAELFCSLYNPDREIRFFSAPGRTEVCGNHTDHNRGKVMAAAINLDAVAAAAVNDENIVRVKSAEYDKIDIIDVTDLCPSAKRPIETQLFIMNKVKENLGTILGRYENAEKFISMYYSLKDKEREGN